MPFHQLIQIHEKKNIWKDSKVSGWGTIENFFERVEFQNRGAAHVHTCPTKTLKPG